MSAVILTAQELIAIYEKSGQSVDQSVLQKTADAMFARPGATIYVRKGAGRGFVDDDGKLIHAAYTIGCGPEMIAVFGDRSSKVY